jgi:hypothetical protein
MKYLIQCKTNEGGSRVPQNESFCVFHIEPSANLNNCPHYARKLLNVHLLLWGRFSILSGHPCPDRLQSYARSRQVYIRKPAHCPINPTAPDVLTYTGSALTAGRILKVKFFCTQKSLLANCSYALQHGEVSGGEDARPVCLRKSKASGRPPAAGFPIYIYKEQKKIAPGRAS